MTGSIVQDKVKSVKFELNYLSKVHKVRVFGTNLRGTIRATESFSFYLGSPLLLADVKLDTMRCLLFELAGFSMLLRCSATLRRLHEIREIIEVCRLNTSFCLLGFDIMIQA